MSYIIIKTDGTVLTTIPDGTINTTSTPLSLPGRLYPGYGQVFDTNIVHVLENFANTTPPPNAIKGQFWFNTTDSTLYVCPTDGETNPNNWIVVSTTFPGANTQFGNIEANNVAVTNDLDANVVTTNYLTVNIQANIANANVTGNANLANVITSNISSGSNISLGNIIGAWTVNGSATLNSVPGTAMWVTGGNLLADGIKSDNWYYSNGNAISFDGNYSNSNVAAYLASITLNANTVNGLTTSVIATPNTIAVRDANGNVVANNVVGNYFIGNGAFLTGLDQGQIAFLSNGTSNISIETLNGNATVGINGTSNVAVFTSSGLSVLGNVNAGNIAASLITGTLNTGPQPNVTAVGTLSSLNVSGNITAGNINGSGSGLTNIPGSSVTGFVANAVAANVATRAGTVTTAAQPNITSLGTLSFLIVNGNINAVNVIGSHFGNGAGLTNLTGANVTGTVANATYADTAGTVASIPSGTKMLFVQTSAPTGWTKLTSADNAALRVVSGSAGAGGSVNFTAAFTSQAVNGTVGSTSVSGSVGSTAVDGTIGSTATTGTVGDTALTVAQIPPHDHSVAQWYVDAVDDGGSAPYAIRTAFSNTTTGSTGGGQAHGHSFTGSSHTHTFTSPQHTHSFSSPAHNHTFSGSSINLAVKYVDAIIAQKD